MSAFASFTNTVSPASLCMYFQVFLSVCVCACALAGLPWLESRLLHKNRIGLRNRQYILCCRLFSEEKGVTCAWRCTVTDSENDMECSFI
jgi:hypothetical protein